MDTLISLFVVAVSLHLVAGGVGSVGGDCGAAWVYDNSTGYCYNFANTTGSWFVARSRCHGLGAQLASIHSLHEQSFIQERLTYTVRSPALWIGLNSLNTGAGFAWDDGTGLGFLNWSPGEPNNMGKNEHCGEILAAGPTKGKWNDIICTSQSKFICKKKSAGFTTAPPTTRAPVSAGMAYACPDSSWKSYKDSCYLFLHNITGVNWNTSWSQCVNQGANLASINDESEQNFVFSQLPNTASGYSDQYWLGLNDIHHQMAFEWTDASHVTFTNWAGGEPSNSWRENCVSVHKQDGRWSDERCDRPKTGYICKAAQTPVPTTPSPVILDDSCPREDDVAYGYKCYTFVTSSMTWDAAMWNCERKGSTLAAIQNRWEQAFMASQVSVMSAYFWIGLSDIGNGDLEWTNNATVDFTAWSANHTGNENDTCVAMQNTTPGVGLWVNLNCSVDLYYICESPRAGFSTPFVPTTTTTVPLVCPSGWHIYNAYCYKSYSGLSDKVSFFNARGRCRSMGADLVSLHSSAEERFVFSYRVTSSFSSTYWIGLNDLDSEMGHKWTDGTPFTYKNWGYKEPNDKAGTDDCVERTYRWNDNNCYVANGYMCKIPLGKELTIPPSAAPTLHPPCGSVSGWLVYNGSCYYASGTSTATWYDARVYCMKEGGDLASVHSQPEYGFVLALMTRTSSRTCWLGATEVGVNTFGWTDGSLWDYDNWGNGEPNDAFGSEKCGQISQRSGYWNDHNCNEKYNYLCKKPLGDTPPVTVPPTPVLPGNCPPNFTRVAMDNTCYGIFGRTTGGLNYTFAVDACRDMGTMGECDIASIGSRTALAQLIVMMNGLGTNNAGVWIGLNDLDKSYRYTWQDNRPLALTNWGRGQPSSRYSSRSRCVVMNTGRRRAGKWRTVDCGSVRPYVCSTTPNTTYAVHPPSRDCVIPGYTSDGQNCYKLHTLPLTWHQAVDACRHDHANLASILSVYEQAYVDVKTLYIDTPVWIGLGDTNTTGTYTWVDTWPVYYSHWARGEPSYTPGSGCVVTDGGYWNDTRCNDTHPFLCKSTYERHEPAITTVTTNARTKTTTTKYKTNSEPISVHTPTTTYKPTHRLNPTTTNTLTTTIKPTTTYKTTSTIKRVYTYMYHTYKPTTTNLQTPTMKWTTIDNSRKITLEDTIQVGCNAFSWDIKVHLPRLRRLYPNIRPSDVYFGDNSCIGVERGDILLFQQGLRQCLTAERVSGSSLVYTNDLVYAVHDPIHPFIIRQFNWTFTVECDVLRNESTSAHLHHNNPTDVENHHGTVTGHYKVSLAFYNDVNFEREIPGNPVDVHVGESVYVKVFTPALDWTVKMRVHTCYTKPADDAPDHMKYYLIKDGCERDSSTHIISQYTHETKFVFREFEYSTNHEGLNVYCDATFCDASDFSPACLQTCAPTKNIIIN